MIISALDRHFPAEVPPACLLACLIAACLNFIYYSYITFPGLPNFTLFWSLYESRVEINKDVKDRGQRYLRAQRPAAEPEQLRGLAANLVCCTRISFLLPVITTSVIAAFCLTALTSFLRLFSWSSFLVSLLRLPRTRGSASRLPPGGWGHEGMKVSGGSCFMIVCGLARVFADALFGIASLVGSCASDLSARLPFEAATSEPVKPLDHVLHGLTLTG